MKIRAEDPVAMKNFILSVQNRVNELKASSKDGQEKRNNKRVRMLSVFLSESASSFSAHSSVLIYFVTIIDGVHA